MISIGDRVVVKAGADQGLDHGYDGLRGVVLDLDHMMATIRFDDPPPAWPAVNAIARQNVHLTSGYLAAASRTARRSCSSMI